MKKARYTESQMVAILNEAEARPVNEVIRKHGMSRASFNLWKSRYGGLGVSALKRTKGREAELLRLKRMWADLARENAALKDVLARKL